VFSPLIKSQYYCVVTLVTSHNELWLFLKVCLFRFVLRCNWL